MGGGEEVVGNHKWHAIPMIVETVPMADLLRFSGGDPVARAEAWPGTPQPALTARDGARWAVAFVRPTHTHGISLMFRGDVPLLHALVGSSPFAPWIDAARSAGADAVTLPRGAEDLGGLLAAEGGRWEFMSTTRVVDLPLPEGAVELGVSERAEVEALLEELGDGRDRLRPDPWRRERAGGIPLDATHRDGSEAPELPPNLQPCSHDLTPGLGGMLFDSPAVYTRLSIPWREMNLLNPNPAEMTPIDPTIELASA